MATAAGSFVLAGSDSGAVAVWELGGEGAVRQVAGWQLDGEGVAGLVPVLAEGRGDPGDGMSILVCMANHSMYSFETSLWPSASLV